VILLYIRHFNFFKSTFIKLNYFLTTQKLCYVSSYYSSLNIDQKQFEILFFQYIYVPYILESYYFIKELINLAFIFNHLLYFINNYFSILYYIIIESIILLLFPPQISNSFFCIKLLSLNLSKLPALQFCLILEILSNLVSKNLWELGNFVNLNFQFNVKKT
jgi:hypothetical protein